MTKTDEAFQEAVLALRDWLVFLEQKAQEYREQLERARRKAEAAPASVVELAEEGNPASGTDTPAWL